jgi:glycine cleavage system aminomethyltransferase T
MTDARLERVAADRHGAREFLGQAKRFLADSEIAGLSSESKSVLLHNATIAACDGILQANGHRVTSGDKSHVLRLETALGFLPGDTEELLERLDASRERRNEASYSAGFIAQASVIDAREAVTELLALTELLLS